MSAPHEHCDPYCPLWPVSRCPNCPARGGTAETQPHCPSNDIEGQLSLEDL